MTLFLNKAPEKWPAIVGCDLETTRLDPFTGNILSIAFSDGIDTWIWLDIHGFDELRDVLTDDSIIKLFHTSKFDMTWIRHHLGVEVASAFDVFIAEKLIQGGRIIPFGLSDMIVRRIGKLLDKEVREEFHDHPGFAKKPVTSKQLQYMVDDVLYLPEIHKQQLEEVKKYALEYALKIETDVLPATSAMIYGGICLDEELWEEQATYFQEQIAYYGTQIRTILGEDFKLPVNRVRKGEPIVVELSVEEINFNSTQQMCALFDYRCNFKTVSIRKEILEDILTRIDFRGSDVDVETLQTISKYLLEIKKWVKRLGYGYPKFVNPVTKRIHPDYKQLGARTGRYSCKDPNMQQVTRPVKGEPNMRHLFLSDSDDFVIIGADWSQQEPRIFASLCGDKNFILACNSEDVYIELGKLLYSRDIEKGSEERQVAKTVVLAYGYASGEDTLVESSGRSIEEIRAVIGLINTEFPGIAAFAKKTDRMQKMYGYVTTASGRRRYFEKKWEAFTEAVNAPVQGTAADMLKIALANIHKFLTEQIACGKIHSNSRLWNVVHDEIEVHCHKDDQEFVKENMLRIMAEAGKELCPDVLHIAEASVGRRWEK